MKAKDLRIGNLVNYKYWNPEPNNEQYLFQSVEIIGFLKDQFYFNFKGRKEVNKVDDLQPIPLTEERLSEFGFKLKEGTWNKLFISKSLQVSLNLVADKYCLVYLSGAFGLTQAKNIKYIHELQNLVYFITGEELILTKL